MKTALEKNTYYEKKYIGMKVIGRSNEDDSLIIGEITDLIYENHIPVIRDLKANKIYMMMGVVIPWSQEMEKMLICLTPKRQWEILSAISLTIQELRR